MLLKKSPNYMRRNEFSRDTFYLFHQQSAQQMGEKKRKKVRISFALKTAIE